LTSTTSRHDRKSAASSGVPVAGFAVAGFAVAGFAAVFGGDFFGGAAFFGGDFFGGDDAGFFWVVFCFVGVFFAAMVCSRQCC
jgi:hypothetical protein